MNTNYNTMKKEELISELQKANKSMENKDLELKSLKSDIDSLKEMFSKMQESQQQTTQVKEVKSYDEEMVEIGSCLVGRHILCDVQKNEILDLADFGDVAIIGIRLLDSIMTPQNKELFRKGLVYFLDNKYYDRYSIKKANILDDETLDKLFKLPIQEMLKEIGKLTENGNNKRAEYMIYWAIVKNIANGREGYQDRNKEKELSSFFKTNISNSIDLLQCAKNLNFE